MRYSVAEQALAARHEGIGTDNAHPSGRSDEDELYADRRIAGDKVQSQIAEQWQQGGRNHAPEHVEIDCIFAKISGANQVQPQLAAHRIVDAKSLLVEMAGDHGAQYRRPRARSPGLLKRPAIGGAEMSGAQIILTDDEGQATSGAERQQRNNKWCPISHDLSI